MDTKGSKRNFKKGISTDDNRKKREMHSLKLRKDKKEEGIAKKRNTAASDMVDPLFSQTENPLTDDNFEVLKSKAVYSLQDLPQLMDFVNSSDLPTQIKGLRGFRKLLSVENNPPVQQCIDCGAVPMFVHYLQRHDCSELQFEAAWALTNIASSDRTSVVVECQALPHLIALLSSGDHRVRDQCAWCLGNVAGDSVELRDAVLAGGALHPLLKNISHPENPALLRNCIWSLSNFCRGKPQPALEQVAPALPVLGAVLERCEDPDALVDAMWALSYLSDGDDARIQAVVEQNVAPFLAKMLRSAKTACVVPALRTLGNIATGNEGQTQAVLDAGTLSALPALLAHQRKNIRKEACWLLSNVAAGTADQMTQIFAVPELLGRALDQMSGSVEWDVRKEAAWAVCNIATTGAAEHLVQLVDHGAVRPLCELLDVGEVRVLLVVLDVLDAVLAAGRSTDNRCENPYARLVDEAGGLDGLELLQEHENERVYDRAVQIIERHFGVDEEESENLAPSASAGAFNFGIAHQQKQQPIKALGQGTVGPLAQSNHIFSF